MTSSAPRPVRAKFLCVSMKLTSSEPYETTYYPPSSSGEVHKSRLTWPRTFEFMAMYDPHVTEDQRYAESTPSGTVTIRVDNPAVGFEPGTYYHLDFTPVPKPDPTRRTA